MTHAFSTVEMAPRDPILGLNEQYAADSRNSKVNLGVGVYYDEDNRVPVLKAVAEAGKILFQDSKPKSYLPIDGLKDYDSAAQKLLFGSDSKLIQQERIMTVQSLGGTGALKVGADFLHKIYPNSKVYISNPSWANHKAIFANAGFEVESYPYYSPETHGLDFDAMIGFIGELPERSIVVLHACCHNPTGVDPDQSQWQKLAEVVQERNLLPFMDIAYQGFGNGLEEDAYPVRLFAEKEIDMLVSSSFSKSFSLYGERIGALSIVTDSKETRDKVQSQVKAVIRSNYSNPPSTGAQLVSTVLNSPELFKMWTDELGTMRDRIKQMRASLVAAISQNDSSRDYEFINIQKGMFSFSGLTPEQVDKLREEFGIYAVRSGRICVAALNSKNVAHVGESVAKVSKG